MHPSPGGSFELRHQLTPQYFLGGDGRDWLGRGHLRRRQNKEPRQGPESEITPAVNIFMARLICVEFCLLIAETHLTASNLTTPQLSITTRKHGSLDMSEALNQAAGLPLMPPNPQPQLVPAGHMTTPKVSGIKVEDPYTHFTLEDMEAHIVYHPQTV